MKVDYLYSQGSVKIPEDKLIFCPPCFFGVADGVSGIYLPEEEPKLFDGRTGGQLVTQTIVTEFSISLGTSDLAHILKSANSKLYTTMYRSNVDVTDSAIAPGACFMVVKITEEEVEIIQAGDCLAVWEYRNSKVDGIAHQNYKYEESLLKAIEKLMLKHKGNRSKMWKDFRPILTKRREKNFNKPGGICILNGQDNFPKLWRKQILQRADLKNLLLFSDGLVPFELTENPKILAEKVIEQYRQGGLKNILLKTRKLAKRKKSTTHEDQPEATAISIRF